MRAWSASLWAVLGCGVALGALACGAGPGPAGLPGAAALRGANILLVTIDTLRADRVGVYGARHPTPALDALAGSGVHFTRAYAHAVMTLPSHASLLTGLVPPRHGVRNNGTFRLADTIETLPERFRAAGYRTGGFVGAFVLARRFGLAQGFDTYDDDCGDESDLDFRVAERPATAVFDAARAWLGPERDRPWFAWIHLFDPHTPYRTDTPSAGHPYDDEVRRVDRELGRFLDDARRDGHLRNTLVIVTSDHGESLGEHGEATHGLYAYEGTLRVPLIVSGPGIAGGAIDAPVAHADVAATLLSLAGLPATGLDGRALHGAVSPAEMSRPIYFEALDANLTRGWAPLTGVMAGSWKYIDLPIPELYDLASDAGETTNLAARRPDRIRELSAALDAFQERPGASTRVQLDPDATARLRSLGYATGEAAPAAAYTAADDPKTLLPLHRRFMDALERAAQGDRAGALEQLHTVIASRPTFVAAYTAAASLLISDGAPQEAAALLVDAQRRGVVSTQLDERLGAALLASGDAAGAERVLQRVVASRSDRAEAANLLGLALLELGRAQAARAQLRRALELDPAAAGVWTNLGLLELRTGRRADAASAFRRATEINPSAVDAWRGLGAGALSAKDAATAVTAWTRAVDLDPHDAATLFNLGVLLAEIAPGRATPYLERFLSLPGTTVADRAHVESLVQRTRRTHKAPEGPEASRR